MILPSESSVLEVTEKICCNKKSLFQQPERANGGTRGDPRGKASYHFNISFEPAASRPDPRPMSAQGLLCRAGRLNPEFKRRVFIRCGMSSRSIKWMNLLSK